MLKTNSPDSSTRKESLPSTCPNTTVKTGRNTSAAIERESIQYSFLSPNRNNPYERLRLSEGDRMPPHFFDILPKMGSTSAKPETLWNRKPCFRLNSKDALRMRGYPLMNLSFMCRKNSIRAKRKRPFARDSFRLTEKPFHIPIFPFASKTMSILEAENTAYPWKKTAYRRC